MENCDRPEPPLLGNEKETLLSFLDFLRGTIVCKLDGLDDAQVRQTHPPSTITLLGLVKHLAYVERYWFQHVFLGLDVDLCWTKEDPDADWRLEPDDTTDAIVALYRQETAISNRIAREHELDEHELHPRPGQDTTHVRWIVTHMIEETARHCGHADLIRESIDGQVGE